MLIFLAFYVFIIIGDYPAYLLAVVGLGIVDF
jgi:hypothetical protein